MHMERINLCLLETQKESFTKGQGGRLDLHPKNGVDRGEVAKHIGAGKRVECSFFNLLFLFDSKFSL